MFSRLDTESSHFQHSDTRTQFCNAQMEAFFNRLNKPLKWMPQNVRAEIHAEMRQHLDALVAANEELGSPSEEAFALAMQQFGDPAKIGRRMWWEWFLCSQKRPSEDFYAVLYALLTYVLSTLGLFALLVFALPLCLLLVRNGMDDATAAAYTKISTTLLLLLIPGCAGFFTARRFPRQAVPAMFWAVCAPTLLLSLFFVASAGLSIIMHWNRLPLPFYGCALLWSGLGCLTAYATGLRKRDKGKRFSLADLRLRLK